MKYIQKISVQLIVICLIIGLSFSYILPAFAPTLEVKLQGATEQDLENLENFKSFRVVSWVDNSEVQAASFLILNLDTEQITGENRSKNPLPVASLTKLMTVYLAHKYSQFGSQYTIQSKDIQSINPSLDLVLGDKVLVDDLIKAVLIGSNNDAATALAHYVEDQTKKDFLEVTNQAITDLGLTDSRFSNPMGFDSVTNYSSARDMAILVKKLLNQNVFDETWLAEGYTFTSLANRTYSTKATNKLINTYPDLKAIKTGFTPQSLGSMINLLEFDGQKYLLIVIGSPDREGDTLRLRKAVINRTE